MALLSIARGYPRFSAQRVETYARPAFVRTVQSFKLDRDRVRDSD